MGSLFQLRDWWSTRYTDEEFDVRSMAVGNVDNDEANPADKIVVGSFQGILRVLHPKKKGFEPDHLLLEKNLGLPILQVEVGHFTPNVAGWTVAVLTPRRLIVGEVVAVRGRTGPKPVAASDGVADDEPTTDLFSKVCEFRPVFEHALERTAFNFCVGPFGNAKGSTLDQIAVQSMDGQLSMFDHSKHNFSRFLPSTSFLVPGPLQYVPYFDGFVTATATFEVEFYKFSNLASSTASEVKDTTDAQGRKLTPDWRVNVGEDTIGLCVDSFTPASSQSQREIIAVCEHTIFCISGTGELRFNRHVDYFPSCCMTYRPDAKGGGGAKGGPHDGDSKRLALMLVGTHGRSFIVADHLKVLWAARGQSVPLVTRIMTAKSTDGMIAVLGDDGSISVNYLGTDPANNPVQVLESKELNYDAMDEEHRRLRGVIQQAVTTGRTEPKVQVTLAVDASGPVAPDRSQTVVVRVTYQGDEDLENIAVTLNCQDPLQATPHTQLVSYIAQGQTQDLTYRLSLNPAYEHHLPVSLMCDAIGCYNTANDEPLTAKQSFLVSPAIVGSPVDPVKHGECTVTIHTNRVEALNLQQLFEDLGGGAGGSPITSNVITFQYRNGTSATLIASTHGGRYKLHAQSFESMWLLASEFMRRLKGAYRGQTDLRIEFPDALPLPNLFTVIDRHFDARKQLHAALEALAQLAQQYRAVQKRLLVRYREQTPTPIGALESIFEETYRRLYDRADEVSALQLSLTTQSNALSCATQMILLISRYKLQDTMTAEDFDAFRHFLSPSVHANPSLGWEEVTDAAMMHLLRTTLSKNARESSSTAQPLQMADDTQKLQRHISLVFDRIGKGVGSVAEAINDKKRS